MPHLNQFEECKTSVREEPEGLQGAPGGPTCACLKREFLSWLVWGISYKICVSPTGFGALKNLYDAPGARISVTNRLSLEMSI